MGMFDEFYPVPDLHCIECGSRLTSDWQSKDLDCILAAWKQGQKNPVLKNRDSDLRPDLEKYRNSHLANGSYEIYNECSTCEKWNSAMITVEDNIWVSTEQVNT